MTYTSYAHRPAIYRTPTTLKSALRVRLTRTKKQEVRIRLHQGEVLINVDKEVDSDSLTTCQVQLY